MNEQDRQAIDGLFVKLAEAESRTGPRDGEAEGFIAQRIASQPAAPYLMAQTIVMQDYALQQAQARIEELERQAATASQDAPPGPRAASGGLFGGLFGSGEPPARRGSVPSMPRAATPGPTGAWGQTGGAGVSGGGAQPGMAARPGAMGGGGFLAGAAQTAMGVAGGVLLGNAIAGMFGGSEAQAADASTADTPAADGSADDLAASDAADTGHDDISASEDGGWFDGGGWFGDGEL